MDAEAEFEILNTYFVPDDFENYKIYEIEDEVVFWTILTAGYIEDHIFDHNGISPGYAEVSQTISDMLWDYLESTYPNNALLLKLQLKNRRFAWTAVDTSRYIDAAPELGIFWLTESRNKQEADIDGQSHPVRFMLKA